MILTKTVGRPPVWNPLTEPRRLTEDSGDFLRDPNAASFPRYPTEPAVQALLHQHPNFKTSEIDLVACVSSIGNLLRWSRGITKPCRFNVDCVGTTIFFIRKESAPGALIPDVRGFGHTFPASYTIWEDHDDCASHQRVVRYDFGGLGCLVRFECDGYISTRTHPRTTGPTIGAPEIDITKAKFPNDDLTTATTIGNPIKIISSPSESLQPIPQAALFDLKTRSMRRYPADLADVTPRLWLAQLPTLILAYHHAGLFTKIEVQDHRPALDEWERDNAAEIRTLAQVLRKIVGLAREHGGGLEVVIHGPEKIEVKRQDPDEENYKTLPDDLKERWLANGKAGKANKSTSETSSDSEVDKKDNFDSSSSDTESDDDEAVRESEVHSADGDDNVFRAYDSYSDDDETSGKDYTACSESCGYCGSCTY